MLILAIALTFDAVLASPSLHACGRRAEDMLPPGTPVPRRVRSPEPAKETASPIPPAVDWRWVNGTQYTSRVGYQMLPSPCGSCWAFGSTGALSDRVKILTKGRVDFSISVQSLLDCAASRDDDGIYAGSCNGGSPTLAYEFAAQAPGLPDDTCLPYKGMDFSNWGETPCDQRLCRRCDRFGTCSFVPSNQTSTVQVDEHGTVKGVEAMKREIAARGPIACLMYAHADGFEDYSGGIITDTTQYPGVTHVVNVVGWGVDGSREFWVVRNSFGSAWGELGYYRQEIGKNIYNMETNDCAWATPTAASITGLLERAAVKP
jgi:cathepsin X